MTQLPLICFIKEQITKYILRGWQTSLLVELQPDYEKSFLMQVQILRWYENGILFVDAYAQTLPTSYITQENWNLWRRYL